MLISRAAISYFPKSSKFWSLWNIKNIGAKEHTARVLNINAQYKLQSVQFWQRIELRPRLKTAPFTVFAEVFILATDFRTKKFREKPKCTFTWNHAHFFSRLSHTMWREIAMLPEKNIETMFPNIFVIPYPRARVEGLACWKKQGMMNSFPLQKNSAWQWRTMPFHKLENTEYSKKRRIMHFW